MDRENNRKTSERDKAFHDYLNQNYTNEFDPTDIRLIEFRAFFDAGWDMQQEKLNFYENLRTLLISYDISEREFINKVTEGYKR